MKRWDLKKTLSNSAIIFALLLISLFYFQAFTKVQAATCGASGCEAGENFISCPADCPPPVGVPVKPIPDVLGDATKWLLGFAVMICVVILIYGGIYYVGSSGDSEKAQTGKKIIKYALLGIGIVGISYAILAAIDRIFGP